MEFGVKKREGKEKGRQDREEKESLKNMKHPLEDSGGFLSLALTKSYFSEQGGDSIRVRGLLRLMPSEYA